MNNSKKEFKKIYLKLFVWKCLSLNAKKNVELTPINIQIN